MEPKELTTLSRVIGVPELYSPETRFITPFPTKLILLVLIKSFNLFNCYAKQKKKNTLIIDLEIYPRIE